ncbi:MAG TPA: hypothetical protein ENJ48_01360, partial [Anaerolineae bacterium]|nr:hypothetical protein [Anaerolineae bacterium]
MNFRARRWVFGVTATIAIVAITACGNRPAADVRPTLAPPVAVPQKTQVLPSPIPRRSTPLPSPVLPTPPPQETGAVSAATPAAPTVARPTATRRPPAFSMPGAANTPPAAPSRTPANQNYDAAQVVSRYAADVLGI